MLAHLRAFVVWLAVVTLAQISGVQAAFAQNTPLPVIELVVADVAPPKMFLRAGQPTGYITEIAVEALRRAGYRAEITPLPWARAVATAQAGQAIIPSLSFTEDRAKIFHYSTPMWEDRVVVVTRKGGEFVFSTAADLQGRQVGISRGAEFGQAFAIARSGITLVEDASNDMRMRKLLNGRIDAAIISGGTAAVRYAAELIGADSALFSVLETPLAIDLNHFGISKNFPDAEKLLERLNQALDSMWADKTIHWIGAGYS